jgi:hypothetical protein
LSVITPKRERNRCTLCKRAKPRAISEQTRKKEPCPSSGCEFAAEIMEEIEKKSRINIVPRERKILDVKEKPKTKIEIVKKK